MATAELAAHLNSFVTIGVTLLMVIPASVCAYSVSQVGVKFLESSARQPEMFSSLQKGFLIIAAGLEVLPLLCVVAGFMIITSNPFLSGVAALA